MRAHFGPSQGTRLSATSVLDLQRFRFRSSVCSLAFFPCRMEPATLQPVDALRIVLRLLADLGVGQHVPQSTSLEDYLAARQLQTVALVRDIRVLVVAVHHNMLGAASAQLPPTPEHMVARMRARHVAEVHAAQQAMRDGTQEGSSERVAKRPRTE